MSIGVLLKPASGMCNMNCSYCFYRDEMQKRSQGNYGFMSEETLKNVIRKTLPQADQMISIAFQGGEPTLRGLQFFRKCVALEQKYNRKRIQICHALQTNGLLLNEEWCRFFKENKFLIGISLDGIQVVHDAYRHDREGNGTFYRVLSAIRLLEKYQVDYNVLTVVTQKAAKHINDIYKFYKRKGIRYQQYIVCLEPMGEDRSKIDYTVTAVQYGEFLIHLFNLWYQDYKNGDKVYIRQFENYLGILLGYQPEACDQRGICGIQNVVEAEGSVYPCDFFMLDEYRLGNFNENNLYEINQMRKEIGFIERSEKLENKCKECSYYFLCRGGCQRNRDFMPDIGVYRNYFCEGYRIFFNSCLEQMQELVSSVQ